MNNEYIRQFAMVPKTRRGTTTVEFALVAPLLIFLLFGIIEFGIIVKDVVGLNQAAREGARVAAVGATPATLDNRVGSSAPGIPSEQIVKLYEYRSYDEDAGTWSVWTALSTLDGENDATPGDQIKVSLTYPHPLVTGQLFAGLADNPEQGTIDLHAAIIMLRE